jgi:hypothetical protein
MGNACGSVKFDTLRSTFSCIVPGDVVLKLHDDNWLHANLDGAARIRLGAGSWSGISKHRAQLLRNGIAVVGADGHPTTILYSVEALSSGGDQTVAPSAETVEDGVSEIGQAMAAVADSVELFKSSADRSSATDTFPPSMSLDAADSQALAESLAAEGGSIGKRILLAYIAKQSLGKHADAAIGLEVGALLLAMCGNAGGDTLEAEEYEVFARLHKHYVQVSHRH